MPIYYKGDYVMVSLNNNKIYVPLFAEIHIAVTYSIKYNIGVSILLNV